MLSQLVLGLSPCLGLPTLVPDSMCARSFILLKHVLHRVPGQPRCSMCVFSVGRREGPSDAGTKGVNDPPFAAGNHPLASVGSCTLLELVLLCLFSM